MKNKLLSTFLNVLMMGTVQLIYAQALDKQHQETNAQALVSEVDVAMVRVFRAAWKSVGDGTSLSEAVLVLERSPNGSLIATPLPMTNEQRKFTFRWDPTTKGLIHTHPNICSPRPTPEDRAIADKVGVPIFTLSNRGMFMYDPETKKVTIVQDNLDWMNLSKWNRSAQIVARR
jgi:hypothetical protein